MNRYAVTHIDCEETKALYENTYLSKDKSEFRKTELELLKAELGKQIKQQKTQTNKALQNLNEKLEDWTLGHNIFGTLKFADGNQTSAHKADKVIRRFWNEIDRTWFSAAAVKRNIRIPRVCVKHLGSTGTNIHYHFTAQANDALAFTKVAKAVWFGADRFTGISDISVIRNRQDAYHYLLHEYLQTEDTLQEVTTHLDRQSINDAARYKNISQLRRILTKQDTFNLVFNT